MLMRNSCRRGRTAAHSVAGYGGDCESANICLCIHHTFLRYNDIEIETSQQKSDRLPVSLKTRPILDLIPVGSGKEKMSTGLPRMELLCIHIQSDCFASSTNTRKVFVNDNGNCVSPTILLRDRKHVFWALPSQQTAACGQGSRR